MQKEQAAQAKVVKALEKLASGDVAQESLASLALLNQVVAANSANLLQMQHKWTKSKGIDIVSIASHLTNTDKAIF